MYAIIATGGKQYKVAEGDVIRVEKLGVEAGETVTFDSVIAVSNDGLKVGEDVKDASVTASVVENGKAKKVYAPDRYAWFPLRFRPDPHLWPHPDKNFRRFVLFHFFQFSLNRFRWLSKKG